MAYDFESLGSTGFQDLAASLAVAVFGPSVQVMGAGRDGGRDMYVDGPLSWTSGTSADSDETPSSGECQLPHAGDGDERLESWSGYTVFQVKHKQALASRPRDNATWLWSEVRKELDEWVLQPAAGRERTPQQLVFITNVALSPTPDSGGHDQLLRQLAEYDAALADHTRDVDERAATVRRRRLKRLRHISKIRFWDRNNLTALLNAHSGVRTAFKALLTVPDVLADLAAISGALPIDELEDGLRGHARSALLTDGRLYFAEAGGDSSSVQVHEVAIDLPVLAAGKGRSDPLDGDETERLSLIKVVLEQADHVLKPRVSTQRSPRHLILTGDPGNGKTTISRFLTQTYRAALLGHSTNLGADHRCVIDGTERALARMGRGLPRHPRWPIRIDLAEYAEERGHLVEDTMLRWITAKVNATSNSGSVTPRAMSIWQKQWPWFVVFDGLDEVTEAHVRAKVIARVVSFVNEAEGDNCDVFVVLTTRPVGYTENISPAQFRTLSLADLSPVEAVRYGTAVTNLRLRDDDERRQAVTKRLADAAESETFRHLLRTPLQVLILSIIIDSSAGNLAPDRFSLFWGYYNTVFTRERSKPTTMRNLLRDHGPQITKLHERVGFELQRRSEEADRSYAALTEQELRRIIRDILAEAGHKPGAAGDDLNERIFTAATQRLVLIAPRGKHGFGFDVRPLQELSAARHLTNGEFNEVAARLRSIAASPHWRNTWIFGAGRIFADGQDHLLPRVMGLVENVDVDAPNRLGRVVPVGPRLALDLLDDGMARSWPIYSDRLLELGLTVLHEPEPADLSATTRVLVRYADAGHGQRRAVADGLRTLLSGPTVTRQTLDRLQSHELATAEVQVGVRPATRGLHAVRKDPSLRTIADPRADWEEFTAEIDTAPLSGADLEVLLRAADTVRTVIGQISEEAAATIRRALNTTASAHALEAALTHVAPAEPALYIALRDDVLPEVYRTIHPDLHV
ncbi:MAG: NACHT domain-containing protein [Jatrophihabitantaceae bacterium]